MKPKEFERTPRIRVACLFFPGNAVAAGFMRRLTAVLILLASSSSGHADEVTVHNVEYPSSLYGEFGVVITVASAKEKVECVAYKGGVPVGSGSAFTTAGIANVSVLVSRRSGELSVRCF